jgi:hypothetical protein
MMFGEQFNEKDKDYNVDIEVLMREISCKEDSFHEQYSGKMTEQD